MHVATTGYSHVRLAVTDIARSRAFYDDAFGFPLAYDVQPGRQEASRDYGPVEDEAALHEAIDLLDDLGVPHGASKKRRRRAWWIPRPRRIALELLARGRRTARCPTPSRDDEPLLVAGAMARGCRDIDRTVQPWPMRCSSTSTTTSW